MAPVDIIPELSWLCALLFLAVLVMLVAACVCFKDHDKAPEYGTAGRLSIARDSPVLQYQPRNGTISSSKQSNLNCEDGNPKRNSWTVKDRALPEIPGSFTPVLAHSSAVDGCSSVVVVDPSKAKSHNKAQAPKPPGNDPSKVFPMNGSAPLPSVDGGSGVTVTITVNDKTTQIIGNHPSISERTSKAQPPSGDAIPGTSNSMVVLKKMVDKKENAETPGTSFDANLYDTVSDAHSDRGSRSTSMSSSPVCIKVGNSSTGSDDGNSSNLSASLAVAGAVPSSDIPYMTPPLLHNLPPPLVNEQTEIRITNGHTEVPYTVISVREPLARVREITMRRQRAAAQQRQQCSEETEDHYAMVPEEEQMYAEIGSGQDSASSSTTYAHIEPRELPPVPPTVESLKSVAHAHSRQASTVSTSSVGSCPSSTGDVSPPVLRNPSNSLYSTVEKNNKQRKTIHLAEGVSIVTNAEKRKKVEDLYAKVRKKRVELTIKTSGSDDYSVYQGIHGDNTDCMTPPPSPWASTTPPAPPPITGRLLAASLSVLVPGNSQHIRRHSADPNLPEIINENRVFTGSTRSSLALSSKDGEEPDYEKIYNEENSGDSCYEKIKEDIGEEDKAEGGYSVAKGVWSDNRNKSFLGYKDSTEDEDSLDPNYECVAQGTDPGYEPVRVSRNFEDSDSNSDYTIVKLDDGKEPGYEQVKNRRLDDGKEPGYEQVKNRRLDEGKEPGYEQVKNLGRSESDAADPGYEKIKNVPRARSDATDPGYERVRNKAEEAAEPGYETVQRSNSRQNKAEEAAEPGYETVQRSNSRRNKAEEAAEPGYETVQRSDSRRNKAEEAAEPGYESVQRSDSDTDPGYEVVHQSRSFNSRYAGSRATESRTPRSLARNPNSTILFVPGDSSMRVSKASSDQDESLGSNEPSATFL